MKMEFTGLARLSSIGKFSRNGVDYTSNLLGRFLLLWRLSLIPLLLVSLSTSIFYSISSSMSIVIPMFLLLLSSGSYSCLVVIRLFNKLG